MTIAEQLRRYRKEKGLKQETIARMIGIPRECWSKYETGERCPCLPMLVHMARVLQTFFIIDASTLPSPRSKPWNSPPQSQLV